MDTGALFEKYTIGEIRDIEKKTRYVHGTVITIFDVYFNNVFLLKVSEVLCS